MKTAWRSVLVSLLLAGGGCFTFPTTEQENTPPPVMVPKAPRRPAQVHPEQVRADNARALAEALRVELDYDSQYGIDP